MAALLGTLLIVFGFRIIIQPVQYDSVRGIYHDFTGIEWYAGFFVMLLGVGFIWTEIRKRINNKD